MSSSKICRGSSRISRSSHLRAFQVGLSQSGAGHISARSGGGSSIAKLKVRYCNLQHAWQMHLSGVACWMKYSSRAPRFRVHLPGVPMRSRMPIRTFEEHHGQCYGCSSRVLSWRSRTTQYETRRGKTVRTASLSYPCHLEEEHVQLMHLEGTIACPSAPSGTRPHNAPLVWKPSRINLWSSCQVGNRLLDRSRYAGENLRQGPEIMGRVAAPVATRCCDVHGSMQLLVLLLRSEATGLAATV